MKLKAKGKQNKKYNKQITNFMHFMKVKGEDLLHTYTQPNTYTFSQIYHIHTFSNTHKTSIFYYFEALIIYVCMYIHKNRQKYKNTTNLHTSTYHANIFPKYNTLNVKNTKKYNKKVITIAQKQ